MNRSRLVLILGLVALLAKLLIAWNYYGSTAVYFAESYAKKTLEPGGSANAYQQGITYTENGRDYLRRLYSDTPLNLNIARMAGGVSSATGLPFPFLFRLPSILADIGILFLLWRMLRPQTDREWAALAVAAVSPVSILASGYHGSTDGVMVCLLLLAVYLLRERAPAAGAAFGFACGFSLWPALLLPVIGAGPVFLVAAVIAWGVAGLPDLAQYPSVVFSRLLLPNEMAVPWGPTRFVSFLTSHLSVPLLFGAAIWIGRRYRNGRLDLRFAFGVTLLILALPRLDLPRLAWLAPWLVFLGVEAAAAYQVAATVLLVSVYSYWAGPFPWNYANWLGRGGWAGITIFYELTAWAITAFLAWRIWVLIRESNSGEAAPHGSLDAAPPEPKSTTRRPRPARAQR